MDEMEELDEEEAVAMIANEVGLDGVLVVSEVEDARGEEADELEDELEEEDVERASGAMKDDPSK